MALKKKDTPINNSQEEREVYIERLTRELENLHLEVKKLEQRKVELRNRITTLQLFPFKPGDTVLCHVTSGRRKEEKRCVIEVDDGDVFVRPYKKDSDELSGRHFCVLPINGSYASFFERCD